MEVARKLWDASAELVQLADVADDPPAKT